MRFNLKISIQNAALRHLVWPPKRCHWWTQSLDVRVDVRHLQWIAVTMFIAAQLWNTNVKRHKSNIKQSRENYLISVCLAVRVIRISKTFHNRGFCFYSDQSVSGYGYITAWRKRQSNVAAWRANHQSVSGRNISKLNKPLLTWYPFNVY